MMQENEDLARELKEEAVQIKEDKIKLDMLKKELNTKRAAIE